MVTREQGVKGDVVQIEVEDHDGGLLVRVGIGKKAAAPPIDYSDVSLHLLGDQGAEMKLEQLYPGRKWGETAVNSLGSSWAFGFYTCALTDGRRPAKVRFAYKGEEHTLSFMKREDWQSQNEPGSHDSEAPAVVAQLVAADFLAVYVVEDSADPEWALLRRVKLLKGPPEEYRKEGLRRVL